ncbi:MAG: beta-lactamase family protein [Planctomycetes bacterium]|nr:beta-lactamase family protein [Planctomycetota bacterium]
MSALRVAFAALLALATPRAQDPPAFDFDAAWREVCTAFHAACDEHQVVGGSLWFVAGDRVLGKVAHGHADRTAARAVDDDTIFHWASCTKTFTGIAAMQLRDRGRLTLDARIADLLPELRAVHDPFGSLHEITIRHLLSHSAGFRGPTWPFGGDQPWHPHEPTEWSQLVAMMPYTQLEFRPGSRYSYSNPGIVFVGRVIEQLSGDDWEVYVDKNLLRPLGMTRSYFDVTPYHLARHRSHSYERRGAELTDLGSDFDTGITVSNGGLNAPLGDMARYLAFLLGASPVDSDEAQVLRRESLHEMFAPVLPANPQGTEHIGLCFFVQQLDGTPVLTHTGGQRAFVSSFYVHPASGTGALAAFNTGSAGPVMAAMRRLCLEKLSKPRTKS